MSYQEELKKLKLVDLKKMCSELALPISGSKTELIGRIICHESDKITIQPDDEAELLDGALGDEEEEANEDSSLGVISGDISGSILVSPATAAAVVGAKRPSAAAELEPIDKVVPAKVTAISFPEAQKTADEAASETTSSVSKLSQEERMALRAQRFGGTATTSSNASAPGLTRDSKLLERAMRFGLPIDSTSTLPETDKLSMRTNRFGLPVSASQKPTAEEEEKKIMRLKKFGVTTTTASSTDDATKKQQRAARFGTPCTTPAVKNGVMADEKLRQRAARFGIPVAAKPPTSS